jgi:ABC-type polysaccharide/polyol phosphate export permease
MPAMTGPAPAGGSLRRSVHEALLLMRLYWLQSPFGMVFMAFDAILLPAMIFYFGTRIAGENPTVLARYLAGGIATGLGIGAITKVGFSVLSDVQLGRLALIRCQGISRAAYFGSHIGTAVFFAILSAAAGAALLQLTGLASLRIGDLVPLLLAAIMSGGAMGALGAAIATASRDYASGHGWLSIASLGLAFLSPVFYDIEALPSALKALSWLSPFTHTAAMVRAVISDTAFPLDHFAAAALLCIGLNLLVMKALPWR